MFVFGGNVKKTSELKSPILRTYVTISKIGVTINVALHC